MVIVLERVAPALRGELSRWLVEPKPGVFIGHVSGMVREKLWAKCCRSAGAGGVVQAWSTNNEQRFAIRTYGVTKRQVLDLDGVQLMLTPHRLPAVAEEVSEVSAADEAETGPIGGP